MSKLRPFFPSKTRRQNPYSDDDLEKALLGVLLGTYNPTRASKLFRIPRQTIVDIISRWSRFSVSSFPKDLPK